MEPLTWKPVHPRDLPHVLPGEKPCLVIDAREPVSFFEAHIDGAINVPVPTFTPRSGAEFGHMYCFTRFPQRKIVTLCCRYSLAQLESDLEPKVARKFSGRKGRRILLYDDGAEGAAPGAAAAAPLPLPSPTPSNLNPPISVAASPSPHP